jgi:diguanylate cyclase (GGDEF)-like protein
MRIRGNVFAPNQADPQLRNTLFVIDQVAIFAAVQIALLNLLWRAFPHVDAVLPVGLLRMRLSTTLGVLCAAMALFIAEAQSKSALWLSRLFAVLGILAGVLPVLTQAPMVFEEFSRFVKGSQAHPGQGAWVVSAAALAMLGVVIVLIRCGDSLASWIADGLTGCLFLLTIVLLLEVLFGLAHIPGSSAVALTSPATLWCFVLMTLAVILRRTERGVLSIFRGYGMGSRIARILAPILLVAPFLRELIRDRLLNANLVPQHYVVAVLTAVGTLTAFVLLVLLARLINRMQGEIHDLALRDELTGLYSVRGFNLLAEQAFRLARRAQEPFGVLFIDMDNLKLINDEQGHSAGSVSLVETAKLLMANFRETDIIGRVGGDEFVVAGNFNDEEISLAAERLRSAAARKNLMAGRRFSISLSMGHAWADSTSSETLQSLIARADKAMYEEKHEKKRIARAGTAMKSQVSI